MVNVQIKESLKDINEKVNESLTFSFYNLVATTY